MEFTTDLAALFEISLGKELLKNINDDFDRIAAECEAKENSIQKLQTYSMLLKQWIKKEAV